MQKKINVRIRSLFVLVVLSLVITGCPPPVDPVLPTLTTTSASAVAVSSVTTGGNIAEDGGATVTEKGICWSTTPNPTIVSNPIKAGSGLGNFTMTISGLNPGVTYYVRAYATNSAGTAYGNEVTFTTPVIPSTITTTAVTAITGSSATSGGNITVDGGGAVTARGVCWGTTTNPTIALTTKTSDGTGIGSFVSALSALAPGTKYYARAYATNSAGTAYGNEVTFTTPIVPSTMTTSVVTAITGSSATSGGSITIDGGGAITARGICWSTTTNPTIALTTKTSDGSGVGSFVSALTALTPGTKYYVRAYATNSAGTAYGNEVTFTTLVVPPPITTTAITLITATTASSGGNITTDGGAIVTTRGICWSSTTGPTIANSKTSEGSGTGTFTSSLTGLSPGAIYYVRAYATNSAGTAYGNEVSFTALPILPTIFTSGFSSITNNSAVIVHIITLDGGASVNARGICWSTVSSPTLNDSKTIDGSGLGYFTSTMTNLIPNTTYYIRGYATNSIGTVYTGNVTFKTQLDLPKDVDGNTYKTVTIGTQVWFAENLKTTRFSDGAIIPLVTDNNNWFSLIAPGYSWYSNNETAYKSTYGALYNWYTVKTGKLCPSGWHVPSDAEWTLLITNGGGESVAGGKLKEMGISHWSAPNTAATNETSFSAVPGGNRDAGGLFFFIGSAGYWWSFNESSATNSWARTMHYNNSIVYRGIFDKRNGFSVRCLRD